MAEAIQWIEDFLANSTVSLIHPTDETMRLTLAWMKQFQLGRKRILDTHLAAALHTNGIRRLMTANPADFKVFSVFEIVSL